MTATPTPAVPTSPAVSDVAPAGMSSADGERPPKPVLTIRIGVTGHRPAKLARGDKLEHAVRTTLARLMDRLRAIRLAHPEIYAADEQVLRIVSPLAEGADRVVARAGLQAGATLLSPLPFPRDAYLQDFDSPASREDFADLLGRAEAVVELGGEREPAGQAMRAYEAVGMLVVDQCDILIAIWDGMAAAGTGGTAEIVSYARRVGRPVLWLAPCGGEQPVRSRLLMPGRAECEASEEEIAGLIERMLVPSFATIEPPRTWLHTLFGQVPPPRLVYFSEINPRFSLGGLFSWWLRLMGGGLRGWRWPTFTVASFADKASRPSHAELRALAASEQYRDPWARRLALHYAWLDGLAAYYGGLHRTAYLFNYVLAAMAVCFAAFHLVILELASVVLILAITTLGIRQSWHRKWIDYRDVAEKLRVLGFLRASVSSPDPVQVPRDLRGRAKTASWTSWIYEAIVREVGLPTMTVGPDLLGAVRHVLVAEIDGQVDYHRANAKLLHRVDHRLHRFGTLTFLVTAAVCIAHLAWPLGDWLSITMPAVGAATFAIRSQGDFARLAKRAEHMVEALTDIKADLGATALRLEHAALVASAQETAAVMWSETADWQIVFMNKPLSLPA